MGSPTLHRPQSQDGYATSCSRFSVWRQPNSFHDSASLGAVKTLPRTLKRHAYDPRSLRRGGFNSKGLCRPCRPATDWLALTLGPEGRDDSDSLSLNEKSGNGKSYFRYFTSSRQASSAAAGPFQPSSIFNNSSALSSTRSGSSSTQSGSSSTLFVRSWRARFPISAEPDKG